MLKHNLHEFFNGLPGETAASGKVAKKRRGRANSMPVVVCPDGGPCVWEPPEKPAG